MSCISGSAGSVNSCQSYHESYLPCSPPWYVSIIQMLNNLAGAKTDQARGQMWGKREEKKGRVKEQEAV